MGAKHQEGNTGKIRETGNNSGAKQDKGMVGGKETATQEVKKCGMAVTNTAEKPLTCENTVMGHHSTERRKARLN